MIYQRLYNIAEKYSDKQAVVFEKNKVSYSELVKLVEEYSQKMTDMGLSNKSRVAVFLNNCIEYLVCFFAIAKNGAVMVPIDSRYTSSEVVDIMNQFEVDYLIYDSSVQGEFFKDATSDEEFNNKMVDIQELISTKINNIKKPKELVQINNTDEFLIQIAASAFGKVKGVIHTHKSMININENFTNTVNIDSNDEFLCSYIISSAHATMCIILPSLLNGCTLHIMNINTLVPRIVAKYIEQNKITIYTSMPYFFKLMLETPKISKDSLVSLRFVSAGGAPFSETVGKEFLEKYQVRLCNLYGKAETGVTHINMSKEENIPFSSIGTPLIGVTSKIMISDSKEAIPYEEGELCIKSDSIAKGYWNNKEEEEMTFGKDGWIHTQDIAYTDKCGNYYITGRVSQFINIGGNKISPFEIEKVLMKSGLVKEAAVFGFHKKNELMIESIIAYIVPKDNEIDLNLLIEFCKNNLAAYKQVNDFQIVCALPRDNNGKVQKDVLLKQYENMLN